MTTFDDVKRNARTCIPSSTVCCIQTHKLTKYITYTRSHRCCVHGCLCATVFNLDSDSFRLTRRWIRVNCSEKSGLTSALNFAQCTKHSSRRRSLPCRQAPPTAPRRGIVFTLYILAFSTHTAL